MPKKKLFKNKNKNFIETGSYLGDGIELALKSGFDIVHSIEIYDKNYNHCTQRFINDKKVNLIKGDSYIELNNLINSKENIKKSFTYWLDGHYSGGETGIGILEFPIMIELEAILKRNVDNEIIYIDDMRILRDYSDSINESSILDLIKKYKKEFEISYEESDYDTNDIMVIEY
jgi:hypothetical protein